jgi:signal transduction histidine kinase
MVSSQPASAPRALPGGSLWYGLALAKRVNMTLHELIEAHKQELIVRIRAKIACRIAPRPTSYEILNGAPLLLDHISVILRQTAGQSVTDRLSMSEGATRRGGDLLLQGFSIAQVVHDYGDVCQAITELAVDQDLPIATEDFQLLNRSLDDAIADAVTEYARQRDVKVLDAEVERQGFFAHELRNHLQTATLAFEAVKAGRVGLSGSTVGVLDRSLRGLREVIDRSMSEVRLAAGNHYKETIRLADFIEAAEIDAAVVATDLGLKFTSEPVDKELHVDVDRHLFASAISNLLQNAFKFTRPSSHVRLRVRSTADRVAIDIEDECGGLPVGALKSLFEPYEQRGSDHTGLGLGLAISRQAIDADGGTIAIRDLPGHGCVFTIEMPRSIGAA